MKMEYIMQLYWCIEMMSCRLHHGENTYVYVIMAFTRVHCILKRKARWWVGKPFNFFWGTLTTNSFVTGRETSKLVNYDLKKENSEVHQWILLVSKHLPTPSLLHRVFPGDQFGYLILSCRFI